MNKNDIFTVEITDMNNLGFGIARVGGKVVFVNGGVTGDKLEIGIIKNASDYAVARIVGVIEGSPFRSECNCSSYKKCGGCVYRHISYEYECELKRNYIIGCFKKVGLVPTVDHLLHGKISGYRNKVEYPVGKNGRVGFFAVRSHEIVEVDGCELQNPAFDKILKFLNDFFVREKLSVYDEKSGKGLLRHVYLRIAESSGDIMVCLVVNGDGIPAKDKLIAGLTAAFPSVKSVFLNINRENTNVILGKSCVLLYGESYIEDVLCGLKFRLSPLSFYQVNREGAEILYNRVGELAKLRKGEKLVDLFCGVGTIGLYLIKNSLAGSLVGVEIVEAAVENARVNAKLNGISNAEFFCGDANCDKIDGADVIVIDPPRKGCEEILVERISELSPRAIVYVSCNPETLARDCKAFAVRGYDVKSCTPVDLFPRTGHVETVVLMSRVKK